MRNWGEILREYEEPAAKEAEMELARAAALKGYLETVKSLDLDAVPLLRRAGISAAMIANAEQMLPARSVIQLLEESSEVASCLSLGLRMAEQRELGDLGIVSLLIAHQPTLGDALSVFTQYRNRINSALALLIEKSDDVVRLRVALTFDPPAYSRQAEDLATGILTRLCRSVLGESWNPLSVSFGYEPPLPSDRAVCNRLFGCPLVFGSEFEGILVSSADLDRPNPRYEPALALHARTLIEAMVDPSERSMIEEVEEAIMVLMPVGRASIEAVADGLGLNPRTLQRRLSAQDARFGEMLDRIRAREVVRLFANRRLRLTDIAGLLGYASLGAFSRWYGERFNERPKEGRWRVRSGESA